MGDIFTPEYEANISKLKEPKDYIALYGKRAPEFEPGSEWAYSNYGMVVAGAIVERVSGTSHFMDPMKARRHHIQEHLDKVAADGDAPGTVNVARSALNKVYGALVDADLLPANPASQTKPAKADKERKRPVLTEAEVQRLLSSLPDKTWGDRRDQTLIYLLRGTGWHRNEVAPLRVEDFHDGKVTGTLKGDKRVTIDLPKWVNDAVDAWKSFAEIETGPLFRPNRGAQVALDQNTVYAIYRKAARRADLSKDKQSPSALRRAVQALGTERGVEGPKPDKKQSDPLSNTVVESLGPALSFMASEKLQRVVAGDLEDIARAQHIGAAKLSMISCGSALEGILLDVLDRRPDLASAGMKRPQDWPEKVSLKQLVDTALAYGLLTTTAAHLGTAITDHRDLIHPRRCASTDIRIDAATAETMVHLLKLAVRDLSEAERDKKIEAYVNK